MFRKVQWAAVAATLLMAVGAGSAHADTVYPSGSTSFHSFDTDTQSWSSTNAGCTLLILPSTLCSVTNEWTGARGADTPGTAKTGSLSASYTSAVGLLGLLTGTSTWRSPDFTVSPGPLSPAALSFKRSTAVQALLDVGGQAATQVVLHDIAADKRTELFTDPITVDNPTFEPEGIAVPQALLAQGGRYAIELVTSFTSTTLQAVNGSVSVFYDDVGLRVPDGTDAGNVPPVATSLNATELSASEATLNGLINPKGLETQAGFEYGPTTSYGFSATFGSVGSGEAKQVASRITGLTKCTTYNFRAVGENVKGFSRGENLTFTTDCAPSVTTLPASATGATSGLLNGSVTPNGPEAGYAYQYGKTTEYGSATPTRSAGSGREARQPLSESITGLEPETTYHARIVAFNSLGSTVGGDVTFTTPPLTGPAGTNGAPGAPGAPGRPGANVNAQSNTNTTLRDGDRRALLRIRSPKARVGLRGKRAGQIRLPIFCRKATGRSCAGTVKIRTRERINPSSKPGVKKKARLVTLATFEYQLQAGRKGYAIATIQPEKLDLMRLRKSVKVNISVQVTDANNNRQTIVRPGTMVAQKTV